jgi:predicted Zn-dependent protease
MVAMATLRKGRAVSWLALFSFVLHLWGQTEDQARQSEHAKQLMAAGKYEQAIPIYRELVKAMPGNTGLVMDLGVAEHLSGHEREAIPHLQMAVKAQSANREIRNMLAAALMDRRRFEEAAAELRELTAVSPEDAHTWYGLGMSYQALAETAFEKLQKIDPTSPYVAALVADTRAKRRQYRSAFFFYNEALKKLPDLHGIHTSVADIYRKTGYPDWAAAEEAKETELPAPDCKVHPAECGFVAGHDIQLVAIPQTSSESLYWQAKAANELALQAFLRLGQLPESVELHQLRAEIASGQGQHMEAVKEWRSALALQPDNSALKRELAISLFMAGDYRTALEQAKGLLREHGRSAELEFVSGDSLLRLEQPEEAVPHLRAALTADPKLLAADASLGLALARLGKNAEAIPHLVKALELDQDGSLHFQLAGTYRAAGNPEKAMEAMGQYQEIVRREQAAREEIAREAQIAPPKESNR